VIAPLLIALLAGAPAKETRAFAVIVANNASTDGSLKALRYADDDGAKYFELLSLVAGDHVEILSVLDRDTQRVFPEVARAARPPSRSELEAVLEHTFAAMKKAKGARTVFYFVYVGHGSVGDDGEGTMHLLDGRFTRSDLFQRVIARSPATTNHVIIDACNAYLMVAKRGADDAAIEAAVSGFLEKESLDRHPNTGVIASTSKATEVHEWSRFEAGVFSHELRSAMAGGADVDGDGAVTYDELSAFLAAANGRVSDPKARLEVHATPPAMHLQEPIFDRRLAQSAPTLKIPLKLAGRRWIEDERGVRYADFNMSPDGPLTFVLVPRKTYFLRSDRDEIRVPLELVRNADAGSFDIEPIALAARGSEALAFQRDLFAIPFGRAYFEGFLAHPVERPSLAIVPQKSGFPLHKAVSLAAGTLAIGSAAAGIGYGLAASAAAADYRSGVGTDSDLQTIKSRSETNASRANLLYIASAVLFAGAAAFWLVDF
jgi:hypothetical protein